ncbi:MAG TPA: hypothetical protein VGC41_24670 [Kofleriaceae bacterium]
MIRIEWDPLDSGTATLVDGVVRIRGEELCRDTLDMRWLGDGQLMTIGRDNVIRWWKEGLGILRHVNRGVTRPEAVAIAARGDRYAVALTGRIVVETVPPNAIFDVWIHEIDYTLGVSLALSGDGRRLAIGYITNTTRGRGFMVYDVDSNKLVDRSFIPHAVDLEDKLRLELDFEGKRLAQGVPEPAKSLGVIRVDTGELYVREMDGEATAVALDRSGELVAYAYRRVPEGRRGRLRFDYLERGVKGGVVVNVLDSQWLESELPDVSAMAFSHDRRRLACLSGTGAIEIVPVP